jgi:tetratricopeptide (TPR) repeat protein
MAAYYYTTGNWLRAEDSYRRAQSLGGDLSDSPSYAVLLMCVGNFTKAREVLESNLRIDPMNGIAAGYLLAVYEQLGDHESRQFGYRKGETLFGEWFGDSVELVLRMGERDTDFITENALGFKNDLTSKQRLDRLHDYFGDGSDRTDGEKMYVSRSAAYLGDTKLALRAISDTRRKNFLWELYLPLYSDVRRTAGFKSLMRNLGLVEYWDIYGWPDFCRPQSSEEFECS